MFSAFQELNSEVLVEKVDFGRGLRSQEKGVHSEILLGKKDFTQGFCSEKRDFTQGFCSEEGIPLGDFARA